MNNHQEKGLLSGISIDMIIDQGIFKYNQKTLLPDLTFIPKTGMWLPKTGMIIFSGGFKILKYKKYEYFLKITSTILHVNVLSWK